MTERHRSRAVVAALAAAALLAACGTEEPASSPPTSGAGAMRPPVAVEALDTAGGSAGAAAGEEARQMSTDAAATADISTMPAFGGFTFEVGEGLPELPANATAYEFPPGAEADESTVAALAEALGVGAPPEPVDDETTGLLWRAGPDDGTAPSLGVSRDPQLSWYYSGAWADQPGMVCREVEPAVSLLDEPADPSLESTTASTSLIGGDAVAGDVGAGTDPCVAPEPPAGVPTAAEAEARANDLLTSLGEEPGAYELETYADEWSASVVAWPSLDGVRSPMSWGFGFGGEGVLQWANGSLAEPVPAGPYPLVDLETAVARLTAQNAPLAARDLPLVDVAEPAPDEATGTGSADAAAASTVAPDAPVAIDPPVPGTDPAVTVEPTVAILVDVRPDLWWTWDADGSVWLLPAYTFTDTEDRQHTVPAVTDEFLRIADTPDDAPTDTPTETAVPAEPPATDVPAPSSVDPAAVIGLTVDEATKVLAGGGLTLRVVREDGVDLIVTEDFSETRVNVAVDAGTVTEVVSIG